MKLASDTPVLVTGADGFIGSHLVDRLARAGAKVTAMAQYNSYGSNGWLDDLDDEVLANVKIKHGDVRDPGGVARPVEGNQIIFHLAALIAIPYSYTAPQSYIDVNVTGTLNLLEAARRSDIDRFVQTSTSEVYGTAQFTPITEAHPLQGQSPYSASKVAADMMSSSTSGPSSYPWPSSDLSIHTEPARANARSSRALFGKRSIQRAPVSK